MTHTSNHKSEFPDIHDIEFEPSTLRYFSLLNDYTERPPYMKSIKYLLIIFLLLSLFTVLTPWFQTSYGKGRLIAFSPNERQTQITALVSGRIKEWYVIDGQAVKKGQKLVEILDNDPELIERILQERDSFREQYESLAIVTQTAQLNFNRQKKLFEEGISSRKTFEESRIKLEEVRAKQSESAAKLAQAEVKLSRQNTQIITAPQDGFIYIAQFSSLSARIKEGQSIATFVPILVRPAVEMYIDPNDMRLVYPGRKVRLQFEGWPAIQFSGWPSTAINTFGGVVKIVDQFISENGKLRIIVIPDKEDNAWPDSQYLRVGAQASGWILLNQVSTGYEIWRKLNNFPPLPEVSHHSDDKEVVKKKIKFK